MTEQVNKNQESELTEFNVHVFIPVRVKVCGIKAANAKEASRIAEELTTKEIAGLIDNDSVGLSLAMAQLLPRLIMHRILLLSF